MDGPRAGRAARGRGPDICRFCLRIARSEQRSRAGQYTYTPDRRPLLGPTEIPGLAVNTGYSGHGIMGSIGGSRRALDAIYGRLKPADNPFRPDRPMQSRDFDIL